jgi:4-hydroxy-3-polyprenylbenzoate decarboxylase
MAKEKKPPDAPAPERRRMVVGITGATGIVYGVQLLKALRTAGVETHLVVTRPGDQSRAYETDLSAKELRALADIAYPVDDIAAAISSGSFRTMGMIVAPCSMRTLAEIATGVSSNLLSRAADVTLKERRRLVLMVRETPLTAIHIDNMAKVTAAGAIVFPPVPGFYTRPKTIEDIVDHSVGRVLDLFDIDIGLVKRWREEG